MNKIGIFKIDVSILKDPYIFKVNNKEDGYDFERLGEKNIEISKRWEDNVYNIIRKIEINLKCGKKRKNVVIFFSDEIFIRELVN